MHNIRESTSKTHISQSLFLPKNVITATPQSGRISGAIYSKIACFLNVDKLIQILIFIPKHHEPYSQPGMQTIQHFLLLFHDRESLFKFHLKDEKLFASLQKHLLVTKILCIFLLTKYIDLHCEALFLKNRSVLFNSVAARVYCRQRQRLSRNVGVAESDESRTERWLYSTANIEKTWKFKKCLAVKIFSDGFAHFHFAYETH